VAQAHAEVRGVTGPSGSGISKVAEVIHLFLAAIKGSFVKRAAAGAEAGLYGGAMALAARSGAGLFSRPMVGPQLAAQNPAEPDRSIGSGPRCGALIRRQVRASCNLGDRRRAVPRGSLVPA